MSAEPIQISATIEMAASPERVWALVSDVRRMPQFSPELRKVVLIGNAGGLGQRFVGINRRKALVWPTRSKVVRWEPRQAVAWHTAESGATWVYEIEPAEVEGRPGSRVTARRVLPAFTIGSKLMTPMMGGAANHDEELQAGLTTTLERIKAVAER